MAEERIKLGDTAKDRITGVQGRVIGITHWETGCSHIGVKRLGVDKDGKPWDILWFDEPNVDVVAEPDAASAPPERSIRRVADMKQWTPEYLPTLIREHLGVEPEKITPEARFAEDLGADSFDMVELVLSIEDDLGIEIPDHEAETISTVQNATDLVAAKCGLASA